MFEELRDTVTKEDFRILRESVDANVSRLDAAMTRLAEGQAKLVEGQTRLFESQANTEFQIKTLTETMQRLTIRTDAVAA